MSESVPVPTVDLLVKELQEVTAWYVFGVSLRIPIRQLESIKLNNASEGLEKQKTCMFHFWLQFNPNASWKEIVQVLEQNDLFTLAEKVKRKYVLHVPSSSSTSQDQDEQLTTERSIDSEMKLEIRVGAAVVERLQDLETSFATMLTDLPSLLAECNCELSKAISFLNNLIFTEKFNQSDTFDKLLQQLRQDHMDTFNVYFLEKLLVFLEDKIKAKKMKTKLTKHLEDYKVKKEQFVNDTPVIDFHRAVVCKTNPAEHRRKTIKLAIKVSDDFATERTLKDIERLARKAFDDSVRSLVRMHAEVGSVIISWFIPEDQSGEFESLAIENATVFEDAGVEGVTVGGRVVFPSTMESKESFKVSLRKIYIDFYHHLVKAVSDEHTCQSLLTQLSSSALISEKKISQLSSSKVTGNSFLKALRLEEEPHLLVPLVSAMSRVEQLQTLAGEIYAVLRSDQVKQKELSVEMMQLYSGHSKSDMKFGAAFKSLHQKRHGEIPEEVPMEILEFKNAEYQSFRLYYADLCKTIHNPTALAEKLHSAGLLPSDTRQRIVKRALTDAENLFEILDAIETAVRLDPQNFYTCLRILEGDSSMQHLCNKMRSTCAQLKSYTPRLVSSPSPEIHRLTFNVRDGILLEPFQLAHDRKLIQMTFHLKESVYKKLLQRNNLELQFKCYHQDNKQLCNWPLSISVKVNEHALTIDRGESKHMHRPLHLKHVCVLGENLLEITVVDCCCSHMFVLQLVHRPLVHSVLEGLLRKRLLPAEYCISKIKRWFSNSGENGVTVSLKCPITFKKISLPARGAGCKHIQCFDLKSYLQINCERETWKCPVCNNSAQLEGLEVDHYIWGIIASIADNKPDVEEIIFDPSANWTAVEGQKDSTDDDSEKGPRSKKMKVEKQNIISPSSSISSLLRPPSNKQATDQNPHNTPSVSNPSAAASHSSSSGAQPSSIMDENLEMILNEVLPYGRESLRGMC